MRGELALDGEEFAAAAARAAEIRRTNPRDGGAAALVAAAALVLDDRAGYERERDRHLLDHPGDGDFFAFVAEALIRQRRYDEARATAEEGVRADPRHARCQSTLGTTLLRLGDEPAGLEALRRAWKRDPYDVRTYNLLNLFEKVIPARYTTVETAHLRFRVEPAARAAIESVVAPFLEETYGRYVQRYGVVPDGTVMFELYGDPTHYAVRTVGLPGIGVAGVCFGRVITSQAPTNHAFNWGMVLAHELAHVFAIQISRSRVPRWFTEGLSELETMRARPEWSRHDDVALWGALRAGKLPTLVDLSTAFVRARDVDGALRAYAQAAVAMEFLERRFGFAKIREALVAYGRGERGAGVLERLAGMPADELERQFRDDLRRRFARYQGQFLPTQIAGRAARRERPRGAAERARGHRSPRVGGAVRGRERAVSAGSRRPQGGRGGAGARADAPRAPAPSTNTAAAILFLTGELALADRQAEPAVAAFERLLALGGHDGYDVRVRLALAEIHRKNAAAAEQHLRRAIAFDPTRVEPHALLVELYGEQRREADQLAEMDAALRARAPERQAGQGAGAGPGPGAATGAGRRGRADRDLHRSGRPRPSRGAGTRAGRDREAGGGRGRLRARAALSPVRRRRHPPRAGRPLPQARRHQAGRAQSQAAAAPTRAAESEPLRATQAGVTPAACPSPCPFRAPPRATRRGSARSLRHHLRGVRRRERREGERERRPLPGRALDIDAPAVLGDDLLHQRQAQPGPLVLGREERVEDLRHDRRRGCRARCRRGAGAPGDPRPAAPLPSARSGRRRARARHTGASASPGAGAATSGASTVTRNRPPAVIASRALRTRFSSAWRSWLSSAAISGRSAATSTSSAIPACASSARENSSTDAAIAPRSSRSSLARGKRAKRR